MNLKTIISPKQREVRPAISPDYMAQPQTGIHTPVRMITPPPVVVGKELLHPLGIGEIDALVVGIQSDAFIVVVVVRFLARLHHRPHHIRGNVFDLLQLFLLKRIDI